MTAEAIGPNDDAITVPLYAEECMVGKRQVNTGSARVAIITRTHEELVEQVLARESVEVERTPIGKPLEHAPQMRVEGDVLIIPVVEEVLVVEKRLILKEEVRIRRLRQTEKHQERVKLRKQEVIITRVPAQQQPAGGKHAGVDQQTGKKEK